MNKAKNAKTDRSGKSILRYLLPFRMLCICMSVLMLSITMGTAAAQDPMEELGKNLFFDANLSEPAGQSCASCHDPATGFTGPDPDINTAGAVYHGANVTRFGNRKPPTSAYCGDSPVLHQDKKGLWIGGMFWDGRATGERLGDPVAEQAQGPFLNPLEQNNPDAWAVCNKVNDSSYALLFEEVWGQGSLNLSDVPGTYDLIALSIAAYERSDEVNPLTSKYDYYLAGEVKLTKQEKMGLNLFKGKGKCSNCHTSKPGPMGEPPMFTDFTYDNLGVPRNPDNPFYTMLEWNPAGYDWVDLGLGGFLANAGCEPDVYEPEMGKVKVPTLRNVDKRPDEDFVKAYAHNGYFKSLEEIVHFYNTRDVPGEGWNGTPWPAPEVADNVNTAELGDLKLTLVQEEAIVAFMKTLSDGYIPEPEP